MRVAFRVDAGPLIGGGHAMRCLTLADALLAGGGAEATFVSAEMPQTLAKRIDGAGHKLVRLSSPIVPEQYDADWHALPLDDSAQEADARESCAAVGLVEWMIVDHYLLDARWHSAAKAVAKNVLVIDDLANRSYDCDLLLDQTFGRTAADYEHCLPDNATVLAGSSYALLRPEFRQQRQAALKRRREPRPVARILVSMGSSDIGGVTASAVEAILAAAPNCHVDVVIGSNAQSVRHVRDLAASEAHIAIHIDSQNMAVLMRDADLAIGAAGTTSWERCCLGLPAIALILAENQRPSALALADAGAVLAVENIDEIGPALSQLMTNPNALSGMSAAAFAIADGCGAERVVSSVLGIETNAADALLLRPVALDDAEPLWLWRNHPDTRAQSRQTGPITWKSHLAWLSAAIEDEDGELLIAERGGVPVGTLRFDALHTGGREISITVSPAKRGTGTGRAMLRAACARNRTQDIYAAVRDGNEASQRLFESCGFQPVESIEPGFLRYLRRGETPARKQA